MKEKEIEVLEYLKLLKREGKIKDYGYSEYKYWSGIPYIELKGCCCPLFLAETFTFAGNQVIKTIYDYKDYKKVFKRIFDNKKLIEDAYIYDYGTLKILLI